jgi:hypothetical protein
MDLHGIAAGAINTVNPFVPATFQVATGTFVTSDSGKRTPNYTSMAVSAQVQSLTYMDLKQLDGINMNGTRRAIYLKGAFNGVVRPTQKGGDLVTLTDGPNAGVWLTAQVLEQWPDWCKLAVTLQNGA